MIVLNYVAKCRALTHYIKIKQFNFTHLGLNDQQEAQLTQRDCAMHALLLFFFKKKRFD